MKVIFLTISLSLAVFPNIAYCQDVISQQPLSKMEQFAAKSGSIVKFEDYKLPNITLNFMEMAESRIRKVYSGGESRLFYQISNTTKYGTKTASIAQEDFTDLQKAFESLKSQVRIDESSPSDYLETKFVTEDGLHLGYLIDKKKVTWYIRLEKYGSSSIFFKNSDVIEEAFNLARQKIESLK